MYVGEIWLLAAAATASAASTTLDDTAGCTAVGAAISTAYCSQLGLCC